MRKSHPLELAEVQASWSEHNGYQKLKSRNLTSKDQELADCWGRCVGVEMTRKKPENLADTKVFNWKITLLYLEKKKLGVKILYTT